MAVGHWFVDFCETKPTGVYVHTTRLVFALQVNADGTINQYKVRIVVRGFSMVSYIDFEETYAPVTQLVSIKLFYMVAMHYGLFTFNVDVSSAFLQADKEEEIWVSMPEGYLGKYRFCKCAKAIPGMKDSGYLWNKKLVGVLYDTGFTECKVEPCCFFLFGADVMCILLIHVDNIMVAASSREWFDEVIMKAWNKEFPVVFVCSDTNLLGVHVERVAEDEIPFSQPHYVDKIVEAAGLKDDQKTVSVPITPDVNKRYDPADMKGEKSPADCPYRSLVMMLMWCARCYRHPLLYAACYYARFSSYYTRDLYEELLNVVRYLKSTREWKLRLRMKKGQPFNVEFLSDSDWAESPSRQTTIGVFGRVCNSVIYATCSLLRTIVTSSTQGEGHGLFDAAKAAVYISNWICELAYFNIPVFIFNDNQAAIQMLRLKRNSSKSKHFDTQLRYISQLVDDRRIELVWIARGENCSDMLTHALNRTELERQLVLLYGEDGVDGLVVERTRRFNSGGDLKSQLLQACWLE